MTSRCYFGKMNSILGSVVPLAMFGKEISAYFRVFAAMIPSFGAKKAAPAFQVKKALTTGNNSSIASIKNLSDGSTPGNPTTATSIETTAPLTTSSTSGANLPQQVPHLRQAEAGVCSSDEDFEKENIVGGNKQLKGDEMNKGRGDVLSSSIWASCPSGNVSSSIAKYFAFLFSRWSVVHQVGNCHDLHLTL